MIRVLIADDHLVVREGIKRILGSYNDMEVIGEAVNGNEALLQCEHNQVDVLLLDISMPGLDFLDVLEHVARKTRGTNILVLSTYAEELYAVRAIQAGASGYLSKNHTPGELAKAIRCIYQGDKYISPYLTQKLASQLHSVNDGSLLEGLSKREYQVLKMLGEGKNNNEIADILSLSPKTVSTYCVRLRDKLQLHGKGNLVRYAIEFLSRK